MGSLRDIISCLFRPSAECGLHSLYSRFGVGYTVKLRVQGQQSDMRLVASEMEQTFEGAYLKDSHRACMLFQMPWTSNSLGVIFRFLEENKSRLGLLDYSVTQTSLDQV